MTKTKLDRKAATRILVVDDHPLIAEGIRARLADNSEMEICGEASSVQEALVKVKESNPDVIITDVALERSHGLELVKQIHRRYPKIKTLVISAHDELLYAERCLRAGAADTLINASFKMTS